jgi:predicted DNA-binding transcriptional regulator AlpA
LIEKLLRFKDLKDQGVVTSWPQLRRMQEHYGFPAGRLLGVNIRAWTESEVKQWLAACPVEPAQQTMERAAKSIPARRAARIRENACRARG